MWKKDFKLGVRKILNKYKMKKKLFLLLSIYILIISCGESKKDRIEKKTAKILITYNEAIAKHKKAVSEVYQVAHLWGLSNNDLILTKGVDWQQKGWDTLRVYYKLDSLQDDFYNLFGEDNYNVLKLKIDDNWTNKMK